MAHKVFVTGKLLIKLNRPVEIPAGGVEHHELAEMLGCDADSLRCARARGRLATRYVQGLGGKRGPAIPVVSCEKRMDPSRRKWAMGASCFGSVWEAVVRSPEKRKEVGSFVQAAGEARVRVEAIG